MPLATADICIQLLMDTTAIETTARNAIWDFASTEQDAVWDPEGQWRYLAVL